MFITSDQIETMSMFAGEKKEKVGAKKLLVEWEKVIFYYNFILFATQ